MLLHRIIPHPINSYVYKVSAVCPTRVSNEEIKLLISNESACGLKLYRIPSISTVHFLLLNPIINGMVYNTAICSKMSFIPTTSRVSNIIHCILRNLRIDFKKFLVKDFCSLVCPTMLFDLKQLLLHTYHSFNERKRRLSGTPQ